jgi:hypothetical protein
VSTTANAARRAAGALVVLTTAGVATTNGEPRVEDGYLSSLVLRYRPPELNEEVVVRHTFSAYGEAISIDPPPPGQVTRESASGGFPGVIDVNEGSPAPCP